MSAVPSAESGMRMVAGHRPVGTLPLCHPHSLQDGGGPVGAGVNQKKGLDVLDRPEGLLLSDSPFIQVHDLTFELSCRAGCITSRHSVLAFLLHLRSLPDFFWCQSELTGKEYS